MAKKLLYGLEDYARDRYARVSATQGDPRGTDPLSAAREKLSRVLNRRFRYDETVAPLYSILQEQYEREAEMTVGRAYANAAKDAGGLGSSFTTVAGEEAERRVTGGLDDRRAELHAIAWEEFQSERQSATEWYAALRRQAEGQKPIAGEEHAKEAADFSAEKSAEKFGMTEGACNAYNYIQSLGEGGWNGSNEDWVRAILNKRAAADGWTSEDVEKAIDALKAERPD